MKRLGVAGLALVASLTGCAVAVPDDRFACAMDVDCPPDMHCVARRCRRGDVTDAALDAPIDAGRDASSDAFGPDVGRDAPMSVDVGLDAPDAPSCAPFLATVAGGFSIPGTADADAFAVAFAGSGSRYTIPFFFSGIVGSAPAAMGFDALVADVTVSGTTGIIGASSPSIVGSGSTFVRGMTVVGGTPIVVGTTSAPTTFPEASLTATGASGFVYQPGRVPFLFPAQNATTTVNPLSVAASGGVVCVGGEFTGSFAPGATLETSVVPAGFVSCANTALDTPMGGFALAGNGSGVTALAADGVGGLYAAGYFSGNLSVGGSFMRVAATTTDGFVMHLDPALSVTDFFQFGADAGSSTLAALAVDATGLYAVGRIGAGTVTGGLVTFATAPAGGIDALIVRLTPALGVVWARTAHAGAYDDFMGVAEDGCGGAVVSGGWGAPSLAEFAQLRPIVRGYDASGTERWTHEATGNGYLRATALSGNDVITVGRAHSALSLGTVTIPVPAATDVFAIRLALTH